jgi:hypothetical protein
MRDPALAALTGAISGSSFGTEDDQGYPGYDSDFGAEFGDDVGYSDVGAEFGDDFSAEFGYSDVGADAPVALGRPTAQQALAAWKSMATRQHAHKRRAMLIDPNKDSSLKIEQFSFPLNPATNPVFGTASAVSMLNQPDVTIRPQRISFNVPAPALFLVSEVKVGNVSALVGGNAVQDSFFFNPQSVGMRLSAPTMTPAQKLTILGNWTNFLPTGGFLNASSYPLGAIAAGPAKLAG